VTDFERTLRLCRAILSLAAYFMPKRRAFHIRAHENARGKDHAWEVSRRELPAGRSRTASPILPPNTFACGQRVVLEMRPVDRRKEAVKALCRSVSSGMRMPERGCCSVTPILLCPALLRANRRVAGAMVKLTNSNPSACDLAARVAMARLGDCRALAALRKTSRNRRSTSTLFVGGAARDRGSGFSYGGNQGS